MKKFLPWKNLFDQYILWIIENDILPMQACIQFIKSYRMINGIIVGVDKAKHLDEIMKTFKENKKLFFPVFNSNDENLINPSLWEKL
jgi:predicted aldo/keto reductase-like oxidoreductase